MKKAVLIILLVMAFGCGTINKTVIKDSKDPVIPTLAELEMAAEALKENLAKQRDEIKALTDTDPEKVKEMEVRWIQDVMELYKIQGAIIRDKQLEGKEN